jgi:hypothetical protein
MPRTHLAGTLLVNPIPHLSRVPFGADPTLSSNCSKVKVTVCPKHQDGIRGLTLVGFPFDVSVKVNPEESPSLESL